MSSEILRSKVEALIKKYGIKAKRYLDLGCDDGNPSKYYWIGLPGGIRRKESESAYGHKNLYTLRALTQILEVYGFRITDVRGCESYCKGILKYIDRFLSALLSLASILTVLCQK